MGKNKYENEGIGCTIIGCIIIGIIVLILTVLVLAGYLIPIIIPALFLVMAFINYLQYSLNDKMWLDTGFWLRDDECSKFITYKIVLDRANDIKNHVQGVVDSGGVRLNNDGQISRKSYYGKDLRNALNNANYDIGEAEPIVEDLSKRPYKRWKKARSHYANAWAYGIAIGVWIISLLIFSLFTSGNLFQNFSLYFSEMSNNVSAVWGSEHDMSSNGFLKSLWIILGISLFVYIVTKVVYQEVFSIICEKPPVVTVNNVDTYVEKFRQQQVRKETERRQQEEEIRQQKELRRQAKEQKKAEKARAAERMKAEVANAKAAAEVKVETLGKPAAEPSQSAPVAPTTDMPQRSREENLFISWADALRKGGYEVLGNWDNWKNAGQWKNMAVVSSISDKRLRITVEYDTKSRKIYYGIAKLDGEDTVSQELLNSEKFRQIMSEDGLSVKNNEWWYCMKFSSFDNVFQEYRHLIDTVNNK